MKLLYNSFEIQKAVQYLAGIVNTINPPITLVGVLKGAYPFLKDLSFILKVPHQIDFIVAHSYEEQSSTGKIIFDYLPSFDNKNIVIVEDIIDTGLTIEAIFDSIYFHNQITIVSLLRKEKDENLMFHYHYGLTVPKDCFVIGYGLDYNGNYRNLNGIYELEKSDI